MGGEFRNTIRQMEIRHEVTVTILTQGVTLFRRHFVQCEHGFASACGSPGAQVRPASALRRTLAGSPSLLTMIGLPAAR